SLSLSLSLSHTHTHSFFYDPKQKIFPSISSPLLLCVGGMCCKCVLCVRDCGVCVVACVCVVFVVCVWLCGGVWGGGVCGCVGVCVGREVYSSWLVIQGGLD